jgi:hypothetical protein
MIDDCGLAESRTHLLIWQSYTYKSDYITGRQILRPRPTTPTTGNESLESGKKKLSSNSNKTTHGDPTLRMRRPHSYAAVVIQNPKGTHRTWAGQGTFDVWLWDKESDTTVEGDPVMDRG